RHELDFVPMGAKASRPIMRATAGFDADEHRRQLRDTGHQVMPGQALAIHDVAPVIHPHRVKHALCDIDSEDVHLVLHGTRLLWLYGFTARALIVAHRSRSAQGRVPFITTRLIFFLYYCTFLQYIFYPLCLRLSPSPHPLPTTHPCSP